MGYFLDLRVTCLLQHVNDHHLPFVSQCPLLFCKCDIMFSLMIFQFYCSSKEGKAVTTPLCICFARAKGHQESLEESNRKKKDTREIFRSDLAPMFPNNTQAHCCCLNKNWWVVVWWIKCFLTYCHITLPATHTIKGERNYIKGNYYYCRVKVHMITKQPQFFLS